MDYEKKIIEICAQRLGLKLTKKSYGWEALKLCKVTHTSYQIVAAFEHWLNDYRFTNPKSPVVEFGRQVDKYLPADGERDEGRPASYESVNADAGLDELCAELCMINKEPFSGRYRAALADLRKTATDKEIKDAYTEFVFDYEDRDLKFAPKKFAEGGGKDLINVALKRAKLQKEQDALQEKLTLGFQQKRAKEFADISRAPEDISLPEVD